MGDELNDWEELEDEEAPESLQKKWDSEEDEELRLEKGYVPCPHCSKLIAKGSFSCIYCCETVLEDSGPIGRLASILKKGNVMLFVVGLILTSFILMMMF